MNKKLILSFWLVFLGFCLSSTGQTFCPPNIDFELGTTADWNYCRGKNVNVGTVEGFSVTPCAAVPTLHTITSGLGTDPFGGFPIVSPSGGNYSLMLGKDSTNQNADGASYYLHIPAGTTNYSLIYKYAMVLENPTSGHASYEMPRMLIVATDSLTGLPIPCASYNYVSSSTDPGFVLSTVAGTLGAYDVYYKTWTTGNMKFPGENGRTVTVSATVGGCTLGGHFGYGYFDMSCGLFAISTITCGATTATLSAPPGYSGYVWKDSATFSTTYGTTATVTLTVPTVTTTYAVICSPYTGYGCTDTLYTKLVPTDLVLSPSHDTSICRGASVTLTSGATDISLPLTYSWSPSTSLSCTTCTNPVATPTVSTAYMVTVTDAGGCLKTDTIHVTVYPIPTAITGATSVCVGLTTTLSDTATGGHWTSTSTGTATIGSTTGIVTGVTAGTTTITYSEGGICNTSMTFTVNPLPLPVSGSRSVCVGLSTPLSDATGGGTWSSANITIASVGSLTGIMTGVAPGTTIITYKIPTGCIILDTVTVNPLPSPISGITSFCSGTSVLLSDGGGGTWSSGNTAIATIGSSSGVANGIAAGTAIITYTLATTCIITSTETIEPLPAIITGTFATCEGGFTALVTDSTSGGTWSCTSTGSAIIGSTSGVVTGLFAGTVTVTYTLGASGCYSTSTFTVNPAPPPVTGLTGICVGFSTTLSDAGTGTWSSSNTTVATIGSLSGIVNGLTVGSSTVTYTLPTGCYATVAITIYPNPPAITGSTTLCAGSSTTLSDGTGGGTWVSSNTSVANIVTSLGLLTGISAGTSLITYFLSTGCYITTSVTITSTPGPITGVNTICVGSSTTLTNSITGGVWSSQHTTIATIGSLSGIVTGVAAGTSMITYSLGGSCRVTRMESVNPIPAVITGSTSLCIGASVTLGDVTAGGSWTSSNTTVASVASGSGTVTGISNGTSVITYILPTGCYVTQTVTVNPTPTLITGSPLVCVGSTTNLSDGVGGGYWISTNTAKATIGSGTGVVTGVASGTSLITYTFGGSCLATIAVTVNILPLGITGTLNICAGSGTTLSDATGGGTWSSSNTVVATVISTSGVVSGLVSGTTVISYTLSTGCYATAVLTVNPIPLPITGISSICTGLSTALSDGSGPGTWTSSAIGTATAGSTGIITGVIAGTAIITFTIADGCTTTRIVTIYTSPTSISGPSAVCVGATINLTDGTAGGTWQSSNTGVATVGSGSGIVSGIALGTTIITYTTAGFCIQTTTVSVSPTPTAILGPSMVCEGTTVLFGDAVTGGSWVSGNTAVASVNSTSGMVTGISVGTTELTYSLGSGCTAFKTISVTLSPSIISTAPSLCAGAAATLTDSISGGIWTSANIGVATIGSSSGILTGISAGTTVITYALSSGCYVTTTVTGLATPGPISGITNICVGGGTTLTDPITGGAWTSSNTATATIGSGSGLVSGVAAGTVIFTYALSTGCASYYSFTVNVSPLPISGPSALCIGSTMTISDGITGGTWVSGNMATATIGSSSGLVNGLTLGATIVTYTLPTGCNITTTITVSPTPTAIIGASTVCMGSATTFSDLVSGGTWTSSNTGVAIAGSLTGIITGMSVGSAIITYSLGSGCIATTTINVIASPSSISGLATVCAGSSTTFTDLSGSITWTSSNISVATVGSGTGLVSGVIAGTATITFTISDGCFVMKQITVDAIPTTETGIFYVCVAGTTLLSDATGGGTWSSSNLTVATVGSLSGIVSGISPGTALITYETGSGCYTTSAVTVNPTPVTITGITSLCSGTTTSLSDGSTGGTWTSSNTLVAIVGSLTGVVTSMGLGTAVITYSLAGSCITTRVITIYPNPAIITGSTSICTGENTILADATGSGTWSSSNAAIASVSAFSGIVSGVAAGTAIISYSIAAGCYSTIVVTVTPTPTAISGITIMGVSAINTLTDAIGGGTWSSSNTGVATIGSLTGTVTGVAVGTTLITYEIGNCYTTTIVTINTSPGPIGGLINICQGSSSNLTDAVAGGTWTSTNTTVATIGFGTGVTTGVGIGSSIITYSLGTCCYVTTTVYVHPVPLGITGTLSICAGQSTTLSDLTPGGTWTDAGYTSIATIGAVSGVVSGIIAGTAMITYQISGGCVAVKAVTVYPTPVAITGPFNVCLNSSITLTDTTGGGTWTSYTTAVATIGGLSGLVTGTGTGTSLITYSLGHGCISTAAVTVNPISPITGPPGLCQSGTISLSDATPGGVWSDAGYTSIATIGSFSGIVSGLSAGIALVTYTMPTGCSATTTITINPLPGPISSVPDICQGSSTLLTDPSIGGLWSTTGAAISIGSISGNVVGLSAGVANIIYTLPTGCLTTTTILVNPLPAPITGSTNGCVGTPVLLGDITPLGTWSSSGSAIIGSGSGIVTSAIPGVSVISYVLGTGCMVSTTLNFNPIPSPISGTGSVCAGQSISLSDPTIDGTWSSSNRAVATIDTTGTVSGITAGTTTISYTLSTGCNVSSTFTVIALPATITGPPNVCTGGNATFMDVVPGGTWASSNLTIATINLTTGNLNGLASGTVLISYTMGTGCRTVSSIIVDPVSPINGPSNVCMGQSITLSDTTEAGTWSTSSSIIASITTTGDTTASVYGVASGLAVISYLLPSGCTATKTVNVIAPPPPITGPTQVCEGNTITEHDFLAMGTWSSSSTVIASIGSVSGVLSGLAAGTSTITYIVTGCPVTTIITVNPLPLPVSGPAQVCQGQTITLTDAISGGFWSSSRTLVASIAAGTGIATGVSPGTAMISYTLGTGCFTTTSVTVHPNPAPVVGSPFICAPGSTLYTDASGTGTWSSSLFWIADIDMITGWATGIAYGVTDIIFTDMNGCTAMKTVTVNPLPPAITGPTQVCLGSSIILSDGTTGPTWISSNTGVAVVGSSTGLVTGVGLGTSTLIFTIGGGCTVYSSITVNPGPGPISGIPSLCSSTLAATNTYTFTDITAGGTWTSSNPTVASIDTFAGLLTAGLTAGIVHITYTMPTGCYATTTVAIYPTPVAITGNQVQCLGSYYTLSDATPGGIWTSSNPAVLGIGATSGADTAKALGSVTIIYVIGPGCTAVTTATVVPLPVIYSMTMAGTGHYCAGGNGVHIGLSGSATGVNYLLYRGSTATGTFPGTGSALDFGLQTIAGTYHVVATSTYTDCSVNMTGSETIIIDPNVIPSVGITTGIGDTVCAGTSTTYTALPINGGAGPVYVWNINGTNVSAGNTYTYVPANGDVVTVTMTSNAYCVLPPTATDHITMTVSNQEFPYVSFTADPSDTVCQGIAVTFAATPAYGGMAPTYTWQSNGSNIGFGPVFSYIPANGDIVQCFMSSNFPCRLADTAKSNKMVMTVDAPVLPHVTITANPGYTVGPADPLTLTAVVTDGVSPSYQWLINSVPVPAATNMSFTHSGYDSTFEDSVSVIVTNGGICPMSTHNWIYVRVSSLGIGNLAFGSNISVQPNPNTGDFTVKGSLGANYNKEIEMEITNMLGQVVYRNKTIPVNGNVNERIILTNSLANGMYILSLRSEDENAQFHFVIDK